ncbi:MAG: hypothetical protein J0H68_03400 [Sphingobacteriia bacterium]|nr:hypothetical protein [Sphingobacteriia bacterium]
MTNAITTLNHDSINQAASKLLSDLIEIIHSNNMSEYLIESKMDNILKYINALNKISSIYFKTTKASNLKNILPNLEKIQKKPEPSSPSNSENDIIASTIVDEIKETKGNLNPKILAKSVINKLQEKKIAYIPFSYKGFDELKIKLKNITSLEELDKIELERYKLFPQSNFKALQDLYDEKFKELNHLN